MRVKNAKQKPAFHTMPRKFAFDLAGSSWQTLDNPAPYDFVARDTSRGLLVIVSCAPHNDGKEWLHVSVSQKSRVPTYDELTEVKRRFIGPGKKAVMVLPAEENHVNIHPFCLHLWHCLGKDPLPEFSAVVKGVRTL